MKTTVIVLLAAANILLGALCIVQWQKGNERPAQINPLRVEVEQKSAEIAELQAAAKHARQQHEELLRQAEELAAQLQARQLAETNVIALAPTNPPQVSAGEKPDEKKGGLGNLFSKMMQDPDTKQLIRNTQRMMMDQLYTPLIKQMGLTPDEATQFKDLLADNAMNAADKASSMFSGLAATNNATTLDALGAQQKTFDEQVKALLGDDRYAQYTDYQATAAQRMQLNAFKQQAGSDDPLNDQQTEALLTFMKEEQQNAATTTGLSPGDANKAPANLQALLSDDDKQDELLQAQAAASQRVYDRAQAVLSPGQLSSFGQFQTNQLQMMRASMGMMRKMFAPDPSAASAAPPTP